jgi:hypothetical protein
MLRPLLTGTDGESGHPFMANADLQNLLAPFLPNANPVHHLANPELGLTNAPHLIQSLQISRNGCGGKSCPGNVGFRLASPLRQLRVSNPKLRLIMNRIATIRTSCLFATAASIILVASASPPTKKATWTVDSVEEWTAACAKVSNLKLAEGLATPTGKTAVFSSKIKTYDSPRKAATLTFQQSPTWRNWKKIPNVKPEKANNAPIFLPVAKGDYYFFACWGSRGPYYGWHSKDMKTWKPLGVVAKTHWATTAEYKDGTFYIYYDQPNDGKPHLVIDSDIHDGKLGDHRGMVFDDPSGGSDCGIFRDEDGTFHLFYEDWSPVNAKHHSWDSPLAGHADSPDGITGFKHHEKPVPVDVRPKGNPKKRYRRDEVDAHGDWTAIKVGSQYYLFGDYDSKDENKSMRVALFTSTDINSRFTRIGEIGEGFHPDPTVGFAEGQFYLIIQNAKMKENEKFDFVSPGPWVDGVEARVGVDTDADGTIDRWSTWRKVKETYKKKPGFARIVDVAPAALDLASLPAGKGFQFEFRTTLPDDTTAQPILDRIILSFE